MKITIIGAAAGIGLATLKKALSLGHSVTALSTNTANIPDHPHLTKVNGNATVVADLKKVMTNADVVLITIGTKNKTPNTLFSDTAKALIKSGKHLNFDKPVLVITGFGAGESSNYLSFFMRSVIRLFLKHQYSDKTKMEEIITKSNLNWEIVRPGMLNDGPVSKDYKVLQSLSKGMKVGKISRNNIADFLLQESEEKRFIHKYITITN